MLSKKILVFLTFVSILVVGLAACGSSETTSPVYPEQEEAPSPEGQVQATSDVEEADSESQQEASTAAETEENVSGGMRTFVIVPEESQASYLADEEFFEDALAKYGINAGQNHVIGSTQVIEGQFQINPNEMSNLLGENSFTVDLRTLQTDQERRDNYILDNGPAFNRFPEARFNATKISGLPATYVEGEEIQFDLSGDLAVRNVTVPVTFEVTATLEGDTLTGVAETRQLMSSFDIEPLSFVRTLTVADEFGIRVEFTAREN
jgi:polyisoprenoid-binding protein YceI